MDTPRLTDEQLRTFAGLLLNTRPDELTCDDWMHQVGGYAEAAAAGRPAPAGSELVENHLALCPDCQEEFDALVAVLRAEPLP